LPAAAFWADLGVHGGKVLCLAIDPRNPNKIFAGTYLGNGLFLSQDGGATWQRVRTQNLFLGEDSFEDHAVQAVAIAPSDSNVVWVAHNGWLAKSADGGQTWLHISNRTLQATCTGCGGNSDANRHCMALAIHPTNPNVVYVGTSGPSAAATSGAVYKTEDGGLTWAKLNQGANFDYAVDDVALDPNDPAIVWAVTNSNGYNNIWDGTVFRSADSGQSWERLTPANAIGGILSVAPKPDDAGVVFVTGGYGLVKLTRNGDLWDLTYPIDGCRLAADVAFAPSDPNTLYTAWMVPNDAFWNGDGLPKLTRGTFDGAAWHWETAVIDTQIARQFNTLAVHPTDMRIVYGGDSGLGIARTADAGTSWTAVNQGLEAVIVYDVDVEAADTRHMIAASASGLFERPAGATRWERRHTGFFKSVRFHPSAGNSYYAGMAGYLARTEDNGASWNYSAWLNSADVDDIAIDPGHPQNILIATGFNGRQVLRSTDGGATFTAVLDGINQAGQRYCMNTLALDPADAGHVLAGGGDFHNAKIVGDLWESWDGGGTWTRTGLTNIIVNAVLIDPRDANTLYAGCEFSQNYVEPIWKSVDGGRTWTPKTVGLPPARRTLFSLWAPNEEQIVAVGRYGYATRYDGYQWEVLDSTTANTLYGVFGTAADDIFAVGDSGTILHYNGQAWAAQVSNITQALYKVWAAGANDVYAVGQAGIVLHYDGTAWTPMTSPTSNTLYEIRGTSERNIFAAGTGGTIIHFDGTAWRTMPTGITSSLNALWVLGPNDAYAAGDGGTILHYDGTAWNAMASNTTATLYGLWGSSSSNLYAVGPGGDLLRYDGQQWSQIDANPQNGYQEVWGTAPNRVMISDYLGGVWLWDGERLSALRSQGTYSRSVTDLAFHRRNPDIVYAATFKAGVYISPNQAENWLSLEAPPSMTYALATGSLYAATGAGVYQLTGSGVVAGQVRDIHSLQAIHDATVSCDLGQSCRSNEGQYMMVLPAGIFDLYARSDGYQLGVHEDLTIYGSDVTWQDFDMLPDNSVTPVDITPTPAPSPDAPVNPSGNASGGGDASGGAYCFIGILTHSTLPHKN
ncbi:MAG: hypothetical protein WAU91_02190, partial [Desulfatitalea sp.]